MRAAVVSVFIVAIPTIARGMAIDEGCSTGYAIGSHGESFYEIGGCWFDDFTKRMLYCDGDIIKLIDIKTDNCQDVFNAAHDNKGVIPSWIDQASSDCKATMCPLEEPPAVSDYQFETDETNEPTATPTASPTQTTKSPTVTPISGKDDEAENKGDELWMSKNFIIFSLIILIVIICGKALSG